MQAPAGSWSRMDRQHRQDTVRPDRVARPSSCRLDRGDPTRSVIGPPGASTKAGTGRTGRALTSRRSRACSHAARTRWASISAKWFPMQTCAPVPNGSPDWCGRHRHGAAPTRVMTHAALGHTRCVARQFLWAAYLGARTTERQVLTDPACGFPAGHVRCRSSPRAPTPAMPATGTPKGGNMERYAGSRGRR